MLAVVQGFRGVLHQRFKRSFPLNQVLPPQIRAIKRKQVKDNIGQVLRSRILHIVLQRLKIRPAQRIRNRHFAVQNHRPSCGQVDKGIGNILESLCIIIAVPCYKPHAVAFNVRKYPVSIVFELIEPVLPLRNSGDESGELHVGAAKRVRCNDFVRTLLDLRHGTPCANTGCEFRNSIRYVGVCILFFKQKPVVLCLACLRFQTY
ncbi:hypothetical protein SDC9_52742 [bioreactor metagenome]|uniref:Uncharacterized protein n=1 Tax=bioreactor metagenome TaxID=1076179 RepID=A0A644WSE9_9ZZZZ